MYEFFANFFRLSEPLAVGFVALFIAICWLLRRLSYNLGFSARMIIALIIGAAVGLAAQLIAGFPDAPKSVLWLNQAHIWYAFVVSIFVSALKLMIIPIVFFGISSALLKLDGNINVRTLLGRSVFWLLLTTMIASVIGLWLGMFSDLGITANVEPSKTLREARGLDQILLGLMPNNIFGAFAANNIVAAILVAFLLSLSARKLAQKEATSEMAGRFKAMMIFINELIIDVMNKIIDLMPYVVVTMIANTLMTNGLAAMKQAGLFILLTYIAGALMAVVFGLIIALHGLSPLTFYKKAADTLVLAFTSRSSAGVLPFTIRTLNERMGVSESTANFTAGLGATIGMSGCAGYYVGLVAAFMFNSLGVQAGFSSYILVAIITAVGSLSIAGIPGISIVAASIMVTGLGYTEHFALLGVVFAIDPIIDMVRTMSNVSGAMTAAVCTDKTLGSLDAEQYKAA